jgi:magnesium transporter
MVSLRTAFYGERQSKTAGLPPGTLIHIGDQKAERTRITVMDYTSTDFIEREDATLEEVNEYITHPSITWVNVTGLAQTDMIATLGKTLDLHPLTMEDIVNTAQRPKMEDYEHYLFLVVKMLYLDDEHFIRGEQVSLVLGKNFVVSFQEQPGDVFAGIRTRIKEHKGRIRDLGGDYLLYSLLDTIIDSYFAVFERIGEVLEETEDGLVTTTGPQPMRMLLSVKKDLIFLRKSIWPVRDVVSGLQRGTSPLVQETTQIYLKDAYDHAIQVLDTLETFRDTSTALMDIYLTSISNRTNEVMKVLTIIATIFIPLTFVTSLYGMNFTYMPELQWFWGYPLALFAMVSIAVVEILYFWRRGWI